MFLNLSEEEFISSGKVIPTELLALSKKYPTFKINWVPGKNTKTMKKVFPILPLLDDDDIIIYMDDDFIMPKGFVKSRVDDFIKHGCKHAISAWGRKVKTTMLYVLTGHQISSMS